MTVAAKQMKDADIAVFANSNYVDADPGEEFETFAAALKAAGHKVTTFIGESADAFAAAIEGRKVLVLPEMEDIGLGLTNALIDVLKDFVSGGGTLVVTGDLGANDTAFLNAVFGFTLSDGATFSSHQTLVRNADPGTTFEDDPMTILGNSDVATLVDSSLPETALNIYHSNSDVAVAALPVGKGQIIYFGWDWFEGVPSGTENNGWFKVLKSAISEANHKIVGTSGPESLSTNQGIPGQPFASDLSDRMLGRGGDDHLFGGGGDDNIKGGGGDDSVIGNAGLDHLRGGKGDDFLLDNEDGARMWGDQGADRFAFETPEATAPNLIEDFKSGVDRFFLNTNEFGRLPDNNGPLAIERFHRGSAATMDSDDRIAYTASGKLIYDPDGSGPDSAVHIATLVGSPTVKVGDFIIDNFG